MMDDILELTREKALELHRQMWSDMQKELGDCPPMVDRFTFKEKWCREHFGDTEIRNECFLCEYVQQVGLIDKPCREVCPIMWDTNNGSCNRRVDNYEIAFAEAPITWVLAQKEREVNNEERFD